MSQSAGGSPRQSSATSKPLGGHQSSWIWGRHLVQETLSAGRWPILELLLADDLRVEELQQILESARVAQVPAQRVSRKSLVSRCRGEDHQGYAARMAEYPYANTDDIFRTQSAWPLVIALDRIQDPYNLGTMLRSAEIFGATGVIIGTSQQVGITSQVARSSVGAVNRLLIARVADLAAFLGTLRPFEYAGIVAASEKAETPIARFDFRQPVLLVIGNEGRGLSPEVAEKCLTQLRIPQLGKLNSLNAAAALAIFCYEIRRQQSDTGK